MSSLDAIRELDAMMLDAFAADGHLADNGTYDDGAGNITPVTVMVDRDVQRVGEFGQIIGSDLQIGLQRAQVTPVRGASVIVGAETFTLDRRATGDGSIDWWSVRP